MITLPVTPSSSIELSALLIDQIEHGEIVTLTKNGQPIAQILPFHVQTEGTETPSRFIGKWPVGLLKSKPVITSDFDEPLPDDLIDAFEGKYKNV
jgi:antitoxin (DNA-binding transcriptional repressor) of toxin-antitoxin stability system